MLVRISQGTWQRESKGNTVFQELRSIMREVRSEVVDNSGNRFFRSFFFCSVNRNSLKMLSIKSLTVRLLDAKIHFLIIF